MLSWVVGSGGLAPLMLKSAGGGSGFGQGAATFLVPILEGGDTDRDVHRGNADRVCLLRHRAIAPCRRCRPDGPEILYAQGPSARNGSLASLGGEARLP